MATADDVIRIAQGEVGYSRFDDPLPGTKYGRWYAELTHSPWFGTTGVPFCAMGVSWTFAKAKVLCKGFPTASCTGALLKPAWAGGYLIRCKDLKRGDAILFDWSGRGWQGENADHVGLVKANHGTWLETIEFNVSDGVYERIRYPYQVVGGIRPAYEQGPFRDVDSTVAHHEDIEWAASKKIARGYADGTFRPYGMALRGDTAAFLHRLAGSASVSDPAPFRDVTSSTPHSADIAWLAAKGISTGFSDGTFRPDSGVARADMAAFLHRMAGSPKASGCTFKDVSEDTPHAEAIAWMQKAGIAKGYGDGTFRPYNILTRGDAMAFIRRWAERGR